MKKAFLVLAFGLLLTGCCPSTPVASPPVFTTVGYYHSRDCTTRLDRTQVPGGWIYVTIRTSGNGITSVFVPDPIPNQAEKP